MLTVVKVGGGLLETTTDRRRLAERLRRVDGTVVLVHGGGGEITRWQERLDMPVRWRDGLRVTGEDELRLASMVLSGWVNKRVVAACLDEGLRAVGVSGEDGAVVEATVRDGGRLGAVGRVRQVRPELLEVLLAGGFLPVLSPMGRGAGGEALNVNADETAAAVADALGADRLVLVTDVDGVHRDGETLSLVDPEILSEGRAAGWIRRGMAVKVDAALTAARRGVDVRIGTVGILDGDEEGTRVRVGTTTTGRGGGTP